MILKTGKHYTISSRHTWLPGVYADKKAAVYAFRFTDSELQQLQDAANKKKKVITFEMLKELRKTTQEKFRKYY